MDQRVDGCAGMRSTTYINTRVAEFAAIDGHMKTLGFQPTPGIISDNVLPYRQGTEYRVYECSDVLGASMWGRVSISIDDTIECDFAIEALFGSPNDFQRVWRRCGELKESVVDFYKEWREGQNP